MKKLKIHGLTHKAVKPQATNSFVAMRIKTIGRTRRRLVSDDQARKRKNANTGATCAEIGTAVIREPKVFENVAKGMQQHLKKHGVNTVHESAGKGQSAYKTFGGIGIP